MYRVVELSNGYQIVFQDDSGKEVISHSSDYTVASKWCERLNKAYNRGIGRFY